MEKNLENMTTEELGRLFPIRLREYDPAWPGLFRAEKPILLKAAGKNALEIHHIGSTAVHGLTAKPVIDILLIIPHNADSEKLKRNMKEAGYAFSPQPQKPAPHMMFMKGYSPVGYTGQAYHVHIRFAGVQDEITFRDYLAAHPGAAKEYAALKARLAREYCHDRDGYTEAKTDFIRRIFEKAKLK